MRIWLLIFLLLNFCVIADQGFCSSQDTIEIDLNNNQISLDNFSLGEYKISGDFYFSTKKENSSLTFNILGKNIIFQDTAIGWIKLTGQKRNGIIFIENYSSPRFKANGTIDLAKNKIALNLSGGWYESSEFLEGQIESKAKVWGGIGDFFTSGSFTVEEGVYEGQAFKSLRVDFVGTPPVMNIIDSEVVLHDGSIFELQGVMDLRDFENLIPNPELTTQKIFIDEWQLFSESDKDFGLKKTIDEKFDVYLMTDEQDGEQMEPGTELRYNWQGDNFLKFRMQEDQAILGFERRKDF